MQKEVWCVKLADRICNLKDPPYKWTNKQKAMYLSESIFILKELGEASNYLSNRLASKIENYNQFII